MKLSKFGIPHFVDPLSLPHAALQIVVAMQHNHFMPIGKLTQGISELRSVKIGRDHHDRRSFKRARQKLQWCIEITFVKLQGLSEQLV